MCLALIVENNVAFRQSFKRMLGTRFPSMRIDEAADGREAMQKISTSRPDVIFMNIKLPGANGLDITRKIRDENSEVVVVLLTSHDLPEYREAAYKSGASYFFAKGVSTGDEIYLLLESLFAEKGKLCS